MKLWSFGKSEVEVSIRVKESVWPNPKLPTVPPNLETLLLLMLMIYFTLEDNPGNKIGVYLTAIQRQVLMIWYDDDDDDDHLEPGDDDS